MMNDRFWSIFKAQNKLSFKLNNLVHEIWGHPDTVSKCRVSFLSIMQRACLSGDGAASEDTVGDQVRMSPLPYHYFNCLNGAVPNSEWMTPLKYVDGWGNGLLQCVRPSYLWTDHKIYGKIWVRTATAKYWNPIGTPHKSDSKATALYINDWRPQRTAYPVWRRIRIPPP
jgi:hypothetical protein